MTEEVNKGETPEELTVDVDGTRYKVSELSAEVQDMLRMHQAWNVELQTHSDKVNQVRAALQHVSNQIIESVRNDAAEAAETSSDVEGPAV